MHGRFSSPGSAGKCIHVSSPRQAPGDLLRMIAAGTLNIQAIRAHTFPLSQIEEAISKAATLKGLEYSIIVPN